MRGVYCKQSVSLFTMLKHTYGPFPWHWTAQTCEVFIASNQCRFSLCWNIRTGPFHDTGQRKRARCLLQVISVAFHYADTYVRALSMTLDSASVRGVYCKQSVSLFTMLKHTYGPFPWHWTAQAWNTWSFKFVQFVLREVLLYSCRRMIHTLFMFSRINRRV